jgi:hypothetical protein
MKIDWKSKEVRPRYIAAIFLTVYSILWVVPPSADAIDNFKHDKINSFTLWLVWTGVVLFFSFAAFWPLRRSRLKDRALSITVVLGTLLSLGLPVALSSVAELVVPQGRLCGNPGGLGQESFFCWDPVVRTCPPSGSFLFHIDPQSPLKKIYAVDCLMDNEDVFS